MFLSAEGVVGHRRPSYQSAAAAAAAAPAAPSAPPGPGPGPFPISGAVAEASKVAMMTSGSPPQGYAPDPAWGDPAAAGEIKEQEPESKVQLAESFIP